MNFAAHLTRELQAQAEKAAEVAKSFKGFDDMADHDTYIHSPDLNVKQPRSKQSTPSNNKNNRGQQQQPSRQLGVDTWVNGREMESPAPVNNSWSLLDRLPRAGGTATPSSTSVASGGDRPFSPASSTKSLSSSQDHQPLQLMQTRKQQQQAANSRQQEDALQRSQSSYSTERSQKSHRMPLLAVVADALEGTQNQRQSDVDDSSIGADSTFTSSSDESSHVLSSGDGYHTDSESDDDDPILSRMQQKDSNNQNKSSGPTKRGGGDHRSPRNKNGRRKQNKSSRRNRKMMPLEMEQPNKKKGKNKNVHRFMDDLETAGEPLSVTDFFSNQQQHPQSSTPVLPNAISSVKSWIQNPFQKLREANNKTKGMANALFNKRGPLSRPTSTRNVTTPTTPEQEDFQVKVSSSLLGDDELAELAQLNQKNSSALGKCCMLLVNICRMAYQHPREAFVAFTMVLAMAVYFYARRQSNEDDVN